MLSENVFWFIFIFLALLMFVVDLYVTDKRTGQVSLKTSLFWSGIWVSTALIFGVAIYFFMENGQQKALEYITGYLIEESLSVDNLFVFLMIFSVTGIKDENQPHILKWGILTAIVMRILFIFAGIALITSFKFIIYVFGAFLFYAAYRLIKGDEGQMDLEKNPVSRFLIHKFNVLVNYEGKHFFVKKDGKLYITIMFVALLMVESADLIFAIDSIPAILAITTDSFVVVTSNIFAVMGLRSLYFALAGLANIFYYLKYGVAIILFYVGVKMMVSQFFHIPTPISLGIIIVTLIVSIIYSVYRAKQSKRLSQEDEQL